jgi:topoisomerase-4 subunit A
LKCLSREIRPRFKVVFGGHSKHKPAEIVVADEFITVKSFRAKGKRLSTFDVARVEEIEPLPPPEPVISLENETPIDNELPVDRFPDTSFETEKVEQKTLGL